MLDVHPDRPTWFTHHCAHDFRFDGDVVVVDAPPPECAVQTEATAMVAEIAPVVKKKRSRGRPKGSKNKVQKVKASE